MLEAFHDRLRDFCAHHGQGDGLQRDGLIQWQAQQARSLADEFGILKPSETTWDKWRASDPDLKFGSEHIFECAPGSGRVGKVTIPGKFGLNQKGENLGTRWTVSLAPPPDKRNSTGQCFFTIPPPHPEVV